MTAPYSGQALRCGQSQAPLDVYQSINRKNNPMTNIVRCSEGSRSCTNQAPNQDTALMSGWTENIYGWSCNQCAAEREQREKESRAGYESYLAGKHPVLRHIGHLKDLDRQSGGQKTTKEK